MSRITTDFQKLSVIKFCKKANNKKDILNIQDEIQRKNLEFNIKKAGGQIDCLYTRLSSLNLITKSGKSENFPDFKIGKSLIRIDEEGDFILTRTKGDNQGTTIIDEIAVLFESKNFNNNILKTEFDIFKAEDDLRKILVQGFNFYNTSEEEYNIKGKEHVHIKNHNSFDNLLSFEKKDDCVNSMIKILHNIVGNGSKLHDFPLRPYCQKPFVEKTLEIFKKSKDKEKVEVLWAAKPRFGKTFTTFCLIHQMKSKKLNAIGKRVLIITLKPNVEVEWCDALNHVMFKDFVFISLRNGNDKNLQNFYDVKNNVCLLEGDEYDHNKTYVYFGSMQCLQNISNTGEDKRKEIKKIDFDIIVFDEEHYGSNTENSINILNDFKSDHYLALSGTAFKSMDKYESENILKYDINDEVKCRQRWEQNHLSVCNLPEHKNCNLKNNPYYELPELSFRLIDLDNNIKQLNKLQINNGAYSEEENFTLVKLFAIDEKSDSFKNLTEIDTFLRIMSPEMPIMSKQDRKLSNISPYRNVNEMKIDPISLKHTMWRLPDNGVTYKLKPLVQHYFKDYEIINVSDSKNNQNADFTDPKKYQEYIKQCEANCKKTITLTCGRFTTGITIKQLGSVLLMDDGKSATEYFQTAYRCQSPWTENSEIVKKNAYVFDYSPNRCLQAFAAQIINDKYDEEYKEVKNTVKEWLDNIPIFYLNSQDVFEEVKLDKLLTVFNQTYKSETKSFNLGLTGVENLRIRIQNLTNQNLINILKLYKIQNNKSKDKKAIVVNQQISNTGKNYQTLSQLQKISNQLGISQKTIEEFIKKIEDIMKIFPKILYVFLSDKSFRSYDELITVLSQDIKLQNQFEKFLKISYSYFDIFVQTNVIEKNQLDEVIKKCNKIFNDLNLNINEDL